MTLSKKQLVMNDIIEYLKKNNGINTNDLYVSIIKDGKFRNYLTRNKFLAILSKLERRDIISKYDGVVHLAKGVKNLPSKDIMVYAMGRWPQDIADGLR